MLVPDPTRVSASPATLLPGPGSSQNTMTQALPGAGRYHDWVFSSFAAFLRRGSALEIGSGHGQYARRLLAMPDHRIDELLVSDIDPLALQAVQTELAGTVLRAPVRYLTMDGINPAQIGGGVHNILLINVLEHIDDDRGLLRAARAALHDGGVLVIFAPAFPTLYGRMDREAGHHRRYELAPLCTMVRQCGLHLLHARYFNAVGFFGWLANRFLRSGVHARRTNVQLRLFDHLVPVARHVDSLLPFLGQSVVVIATKGT